MKPKTIIPLIIGLGVGFFAIKMGINMVQRAKGSQEESRGVCVSARHIEVASSLTDSMVMTRKVAASLVPSDSFLDKKALIGRVTKMPIAAGIPITQAMLAPPGAEPGLGARIPIGFRAVSVRVNEETAVAGFIVPGSRVDVSAVSRKGAKSRLILSNVEVGAVGQSLSKTGPDGTPGRVAKSVTLFLLPEQVQVLNAAIGTGRKGLRLALRGHGSDPAESVMSKLLSQAFDGDLLPSEDDEPEAKPKAETEQAPEPEPEPEIHIVQVRRGQQIERLAFDEFGGIRSVTADPSVLRRRDSRVGAKEPEHRVNDRSEDKADDGPDGDAAGAPEDGADDRDAIEQSPEDRGADK